MSENVEDVVLIVRFRAKEGCEAELERILAGAVIDAHENDPGAVRFVLHRVVDEPREFVLYEWFRSRQALDDRRQRPATAALRVALQDVRESAEEVLVSPIGADRLDLLDPQAADKGEP